MHVRLAFDHDEDEVVRLARAYAGEVSPQLPHVEFDEAITRQNFRASLATAEPTVFVCEHHNALLGFVVATIRGFYFMGGVWTNLDIFYVHPDYRGTRAATLLLAEFCSWSDLLGAKVSISGNANKLNTDRTARFHSRFGFEPAGLTLLRPKGD